MRSPQRQPTRGTAGRGLPSWEQLSARLRSQSGSPASFSAYADRTIVRSNVPTDESFGPIAGCSHILTVTISSHCNSISAVLFGIRSSIQSASRQRSLASEFTWSTGPVESLSPGPGQRPCDGGKSRYGTAVPERGASTSSGQGQQDSGGLPGAFIANTLRR